MRRGCACTLWVKGVICAYDLSPLSDTSAANSGNSSQPKYVSPESSPPRLACVFDAVASAKLYLESVARNRMYPPATGHAVDLGNITFPGGIASAKAGVGNMEGARDILKRHELESRSAAVAANGGVTGSSRREFANVAGILHPVSIHLVPASESKSLSLVAITGGGLRYYLSSLSSTSINFAQASQGGFDYSGAGNNFGSPRMRPDKKMTFCHIRAPPPYTTGDGNDGFRFELAPSAINQFGVGGGGMLPGIHNIQSSVVGKGLSARGDVVKGFFGKGVFVLALDLEKQNRTNDRGNKSNNTFNPNSRDQHLSTPGDAIVAALPDYAARMIETSSVTSTTLTNYTGNGATPPSAPGGISESILLPMAGVGGTKSPVLPGGRTFDIVASAGEQSSVLGLFMYSETPSDAELQVGLISSFTPPMSRGRKLFQSTGVTSSSVASSNDGRGVISSALSAISSYLRSGQGSRYQVGTILSDPNGFGTAQTYRVSKRHGCDKNGFSNSASEIALAFRNVNRQRPNNSRGDVAKSARLPSWLLRPPAAPLNIQATQHLLPPGSGSIVVLNAGGLHVFQKSSLLNNFASVLLRATNMSKDALVKNFFTSYGHTEVCAMCYALITSSSSSDLLVSKAEQALMCHAHRPSMRLEGPSAGNGNDPISAYKFQPSFLYEGLVKFFSRLLRPFWYKPAVVVTEGRPIRNKSIYSNYYTSMPAKVELLLNDATLDDIRRPLVTLQNFMKRVFVPAVKAIPGASNKASTDAMEMDIDEDRSSGGLITTAMQNHSRATQHSGNTSHPRFATSHELQTTAFRTEERNIHSLYRLLSRCVQMLDLISCLKRADSTSSLPEVQWGLIHGLTFNQLVTSEDGQQRVEALLNGLVSLDQSSLVGTFSSDGDSLADTLSRKCYLFFSASSRLTYCGFRSARDALSLSPSSARRAELSNQAASFFRSAARHWYSPHIVVGRLFSKGRAGSWEDVAESAIGAQSPLALAASVLMELGNSRGLADVCLICASNFGGAKVPRDESKELGESPVKDMFSWERGLYHHPQSDLQKDQKAAGAQAIVDGMDISAGDALRTCHSLLFHYISKLLRSGELLNSKALADELVQACASSSDVNFLHSLYEHLIKTNHSDTLLRIDSSSLETWLQNEKKDCELLWRYYSFHNRNVLAGEIMTKEAESGAKIHLRDRVQYLTRAIDSFAAALHANRSKATVDRRFVGALRQGRIDKFKEQQVSVDDLNSRIKNIQEKLDVAKIQQRVLSTVEQSENTDLTPAKAEELSYSLVNVSDIYNEYACALNLFDVCLLILETCRHNERETIASLWKNIICEEIFPCQTSSESVADFLNTLKQGTVFEDSNVQVGDDPSGKLQKFDSGEWIPRLKGRVSILGKELYGKGADYTFPLDFLVMELEGIRQKYDEVRNDVPSQPWPIQAMIEAEVPFHALLASYDMLSESTSLQGVDIATRLRRISNICELLRLWVEAAIAQRGLELSSINATMNAAAQLARATNHGGLLNRIDQYKSFLDGLGDNESERGAELSSHFMRVKEEIRNFF